MLWKTTTLLVLAACTPPNYRVVEPDSGNGEMGLGDILANARTPRTAEAVMLLEMPLETSFDPMPIVEVREYPARWGATVLAPPRVEVYRHAGNTDILDSILVTMTFTTGRTHGVSTRNAWLIISPVLLDPPIDWGPITQHVDFGIILPFPAGVMTDYGPGGQFHRQASSGAIQVNGEFQLPAPMYLQLVVEAPEENELGFVVSHAYGLFPGDV